MSDGPGRGRLAILDRPELRLPWKRLLALYAGFVVLQILLAVGLELAGGDIDTKDVIFAPGPQAIGLVAYVALAAATLALAARTPDPRAALGLVRPPSWSAAVGWAVLGFFVVAATAVALEPLLGGAESQDLTPGPFPGTPSAWLGLALGVVAICLLGPFTEELFFRGAGYAALRPRLTSILTALVTGAAFGAAHFQPRAFVVLAVFGFVAGMIYERTGSIAAPAIMHLLNNSAAYIFALLAA